MPYICVSKDNRYIGEHICDNHHYGDMSIVRPCCVEDAKERKTDCIKYALTTNHPNYVIFEAAWNSLTDAEKEIVGDIEQCPGIANGFQEVEKEDYIYKIEGKDAEKAVEAIIVYGFGFLRPILGMAEKNEVISSWGIEVLEDVIKTEGLSAKLSYAGIEK